MTSLADLKLIDILPSSIAEDEQFQALAETFDKQLKGILASIPAIEIYSRIEEHEEPLLSLLAWQFHVDHWDANWSVETKREAVKNSIKLHKKKGTPWAVEKAVEIATGERAEVLEWFNYDGDPYMFKVAVHGQVRDCAPILTAINSAKNVRSHLDSIQIPHTENAAANVAGLPRIGISITGSLSNEISTEAAHAAGTAIVRMSFPISGTLPRTDISTSVEPIISAGIVRMGFSITGATQ
ncbi:MULTISPECIES: phage tail protein I [unclassified Maridesulfovibrio]|uniref:phage tail protein I n=1 Tax=unclassified Maridesulfovibrio TaxID=2794999 RepID=UPI003B3F0F3D